MTTNANLRRLVMEKEQSYLLAWIMSVCLLKLFRILNCSGYVLNLTYSWHFVALKLWHFLEVVCIVFWHQWC